MCCCCAVVADDCEHKKLSKGVTYQQPNLFSMDADSDVEVSLSEGFLIVEHLEHWQYLDSLDMQVCLGLASGKDKAGASDGHSLGISAAGCAH